ncbi:MAG: hypothetical protein E7523_00510 [Ruminococcaceae bacterium]|nr:hypothetical protein [Oscillospiraceae bacterium]
MIPVLYKANATNFKTYGIGTLTDCTFCEVTEERNGSYELVLKYPTNGPLYTEIQTERLIKAKPNDTSDNQLFRIYRITTPIENIITVYAQHISYDLCNIAELIWSDENMSAPLVMNKIFSNTATTHNFICSTDYSSSKPFSVSRPQSVRACLGGAEGSMLSLWGGEFEWDNFHIIHHQGRGTKTGVVIEYGKNLTALEHENDNTALYTDILPFAVSSDMDGNETVVTLSEVLLPVVDTSLTTRKTLIKDFSDSFSEGEELTESALRSKANTYIENNALGTVIPNIKVSFEPLWKYPEYATVLERVSLCDTLLVRHSKLGLKAKAKVITTVYDTLSEKYVSITLGASGANLLHTISEVQENTDKAVAKVERFPKLMNAAIERATGLITGQSGGYVVINTYSENGQPYELLILDNPDINTAVNVWRWNVGGLGFSSNGYNGPYTTAITSGGEIVADFITSGTLVANIIKAGVLQSQDGSSYWDLETGEVHLNAYATTSSLEETNLSIEGIQEDIVKTNEKTSELQTTAEGLTSYVSDLTETVKTVTDELGNQSDELIVAQEKISELEHTVEGLGVKVSERFIGGINLVKNSSGLNGLSDDWTYSGTVSSNSATDTQNNTTADSCFVLGAYSDLTQVITGVVTGTSYVVSLRAKKTSTYSGYFRVTYNGDKYVDLFNTSSAFDWQDFTAVIDDVQDGTITIYAYSRAASLYIGDIMITEGSIVQKWTPAPNEIYTTEVKIDRRGIEVSNADSPQRTVINNTEFSGYYNDEKIFTLNKDETITKKTTVDGELTVGKTKFVPMPTASDGLNIVILD